MFFVDLIFAGVMRSPWAISLLLEEFLTKVRSGISVGVIWHEGSEVAEAIHNTLNRKVIFTDAHKDDINDTLKIVTTFCARAEEAALVEAVEEVDSDAIVIINDAANIHGSIFTKNKHH